MLQLLEKRLYCEELPGTSKKLVSILVTFVSMTDSSKEVVRVLCIYYPVWFQESLGQKN